MTYNDYHLQSFLSFQCEDMKLLERIVEEIELNFQARVVRSKHDWQFIVLPKHRNDKDERRALQYFLAGCDFAENFERVGVVSASDVDYIPYYDQKGELYK